MQRRLLFTCRLLGLVFFLSVAASKYSKENNDREDLKRAEAAAAKARDRKPADFGRQKQFGNDHFPFRSKKGIMIWDKANQKYKGNTAVLDSIRDDLLVIDQELMRLKQLKYDNKDPHGDLEGSLEEKVHALLVNYDMTGINVQSPTEIKIGNKVDDNIKVDKRLDRLYDRAQKMGFTAEELEELKTEILHHKLKMAELDALMGKYSTLEEKARLETNVVGKKEGKNESPQNTKIKELKEMIKDKRQEIGDSMNRLSMLSENPELARDMTFTHPKVLELWSDIVRSNFTSEERTSLRQELMHLESKMNKRDKLNHDKEVLEKHHEEQGHMADEAKREKYLAKKEKIDERSDYLDKHVNKYVKTINARIDEKRQRSEL